MQQFLYDAATATALLELAFPDWDLLPYVIKADGVHQSDQHRETSPPEEVFDWTPAYDMGGPGSPNPMTAPMLPIPFSAAQLAVFMLDGAGAMVPEALGCRIGDGEPTLEKVGHPRHRKVREALQEAFSMITSARRHIGSFDYGKQAVALALTEQYDEEDGRANKREGVFEAGISEEERRIRRARAVGSVAALKARSKEAMEATAEDWKTWRKAMVHELLLQKSKRYTGVCDLRWSEAQAHVGDKFTPEVFRSGWPKALEPSRLGNLQFPREGISPQDIDAINRLNDRQHWVMEALTGLCERGELICEPIQHVRRDAGTGMVVMQWPDFLIEPQPFLDWLAKHGLAASHFIVSWCAANGISSIYRESAQQTPSQRPPGDLDWQSDSAQEGAPNIVGGRSDTRAPATHAENLAAAKDAMKKHGDNQVHAAKELGVSPKTLRRHLGIDGTAKNGGSRTGAAHNPFNIPSPKKR